MGEDGGGAKYVWERYFIYLMIVNICLYHRISKVFEGKKGGTEGRKGGWEGGYIRTLESGRSKKRQQFLAPACLAHGAWQATEWRGSVEGSGHVIAALKSGTHSYLSGTIILKPNFIPDTSSLLWKKQPSCEVSSSLKSKDPNQEFAKASSSQSFLPETNLSRQWSLKSLNPKLK